MYYHDHLEQVPGLMDEVVVELADGFVDTTAKKQKRNIKVDHNGRANQSKGCGGRNKVFEDAILGLSKVSKKYVILFITMLSLPIICSSFY
jgi:hypothetical protein